jgi:hypothetical protein
LVFDSRLYPLRMLDLYERALDEPLLPSRGRSEHQQIVHSEVGAGQSGGCRRGAQ